MANEAECETCGGDRVTAGTVRGRNGEDVDDVQPCPDCGDDGGVDVDMETMPRERVDLVDERLGQRFDVGGEA